MDDDNLTVTAVRGTGASVEEVNIEEQSVPGAAPAEDFRGFNTQLRYAFLECNLRIQQARQAGDLTAERAARADREAVAAQFVAKNTRLAQAAAHPLMIKDRELSQEHLQAAMLGLWEAFVGTDPAAVDGVIVDEAGNLHPTSGWDPAKGTFATYASSSIAGRAKRSVRASEGAFTGISYHTWGQKPKVDEARRALQAELGRTPSIAQIAQRAGVTEDTVRACSKSAPASLDALVAGDGGTTLGDLIADTEPDGASPSPSVDHAEVELVRRAQDMSAVDLLVLLLRTGLAGAPPRSVVQTADRLGIGRGSVAPAMARAEKALVRA